MKMRNHLLLTALTLAGGLMLWPPIAARANPTVGRAAPSATFKSGGRNMSLANYRGQKVMLWMFSTWCPSCRVGLAALANQQAVLKAAGVQLVILENYKDGGYSGPPLKQLIAKRAGTVKAAPNWTFGKVTQKMATVYNASGYPDIYYLIGADGKIVGISSSPASSMQKILSFARK